MNSLPSQLPPGLPPLSGSTPPSSVPGQKSHSLTEADVKAREFAQKSLSELTESQREVNSFVLIGKEPEAPEELNDFVLIGVETEEKPPSTTLPPSTPEVRAVSSSSSPSTTSSSSSWSLMSAVVGLATKLNLVGNWSQTAAPKEGSTAALVEVELKKGALVNFNRAKNSQSTDGLQKALDSLRVEHLMKAFLSEAIERDSINTIVVFGKREFNLRDQLLPDDKCEAALINSVEGESKSVGKFIGEIKKENGKYFLKKPSLEDKVANSTLNGIQKEFSDYVESQNLSVDLKKGVFNNVKNKVEDVEIKFSESYKQYSIASFNALFSDVEGLNTMNDEEKHAFMSLFGVSDFANFSKDIKTIFGVEERFNEYSVRQSPDRKVDIKVSQGEEGWVLSKTFTVQLLDNNEPEAGFTPPEGGMPVTIQYNLTKRDEMAQVG